MRRFREGHREDPVRGAGAGQWMQCSLARRAQE